jgi:hypothetical protein
MCASCVLTTCVSLNRILFLTHVLLISIFAAFFLGSSPELLDKNVIVSSAKADRSRLTTTTAGKVILSVDVLLRNTHLYNLSYE